MWQMWVRKSAQLGWSVPAASMGGTSAGLAVGARETRVVAVGAAEWTEHERVGGSWAVARVGSVRGAREPAGEEGVTDGVSVQGASLASGRGVSRARRGVDVGWLSSAVCWLWGGWLLAADGLLA